MTSDNNNPKITVIVPIYKVERYLRQCVDSILGQDYGNLEVILVDDGSPDGCPAICDEYAANDRRVKVIHKANAGLGMARNTGMQAATGDYIMFIDSDDWWQPGVLGTLVKKAVDTDADILMYGYRRQLPGGSFVNDPGFDGERSFDTPEQILALASSIVRANPKIGPNKTNMSAWTMLINRRIGDVPFYSEREVASEDMPHKVELFLKAKRIVSVPVVVVNYRWADSSLSRTYSFDKFHKFKRLTEILQQLLPGAETGHAADYTMIYAAASAFQGLYNSGTPLKARIRGLRLMAADPVWKNLHIDSAALTRKERMSIGPIMHGHWFRPWLTSELYYAIKRLSPNRVQLHAADSAGSANPGPASSATTQTTKSEQQ